jgi:hypothetical protein
MSSFIKFWSFQVHKTQNQSNLTQFGSLNCNSNSILDFEKLQWGNLFLFQYLNAHIYLKIFKHQKAIFDRFKFESIWKIKNRHCSRGLAHRSVPTRPCYAPRCIPSMCAIGCRLLPPCGTTGASIYPRPWALPSPNAYKAPPPLLPSSVSATRALHHCCHSSSGVQVAPTSSLASSSSFLGRRCNTPLSNSCNRVLIMLQSWVRIKFK